jgi:hypothetical protein
MIVNLWEHVLLPEDFMDKQNIRARRPPIDKRLDDPTKYPNVLINFIK